MVRRPFTRTSSPGAPNPGRKQKPDRLSHRTSWRGDFLRPAATSRSASPSRRIAEIGHESLFAPSATSIWLASVSGARVSLSEPPKTPRISCKADSTAASEIATADERVSTGCGFAVSSRCACASSPRSSNCSRQRCGVFRDSHQISSVPTSVKLALRRINRYTSRIFLP